MNAYARHPASAPTPSEARAQSAYERAEAVNERARKIIQDHTDRYVKAVREALAAQAPDVLENGEFARMEYRDRTCVALGRYRQEIFEHEMTQQVIATLEEGVIYPDPEAEAEAEAAGQGTYWLKED